MSYSVSCKLKGFSVTNVRPLDNLPKATNKDKNNHINYQVEPLLDDKNPARRFLLAIHAFKPKKGTLENPNGLLSDNPEKFYADFKDLCERTQKLLKTGSKCPAVSGPAVIIGDIHGNLDDLITIEQTVWRYFSLSPMRFVFLGDYVDR